MKECAKKYPNLVELTRIGKTFENRHIIALKVLIFTKTIFR